MEVNTNEPIQDIVYANQLRKTNQGKVSKSAENKSVAGDRAEVSGVQLTREMSISVAVEKVVEHIKSRLPEVPVSTKNLEYLQQDTSPEATSGRIVNFAKVLSEQYQIQHPELSQVEAYGQFYKEITGAIEDGFNQAKDILESMGGLSGDITATINKTYDLVFKKLSDWYNEAMEKLLGPPAVPEEIPWTSEEDPKVEKTTETESNDGNVDKGALIE